MFLFGVFLVQVVDLLMLCVGDQNYYNVWVLMEVLGVFEGVFYQVEWKYFQFVVLVVEGLQVGVLDLGFFGDLGFIFFVVKGVLVKLVGVLWQNFDIIVLLVLKDFLVCSIVDFKGRKVVYWFGVWSQ